MSDLERLYDMEFELEYNGDTGLYSVVLQLVKLLIKKEVA